MAHIKKNNNFKHKVRENSIKKVKRHTIGENISLFGKKFVSTLYKKKPLTSIIKTNKAIKTGQ